MTCNNSRIANATHHAANKQMTSFTRAFRNYRVWSSVNRIREPLFRRVLLSFSVGLLNHEKVALLALHFIFQVSTIRSQARSCLAGTIETTTTNLTDRMLCYQLYYQRWCGGWYDVVSCFIVPIHYFRQGTVIGIPLFADKCNWLDTTAVRIINIVIHNIGVVWFPRCSFPLCGHHCQVSWQIITCHHLIRCKKGKKLWSTHHRITVSFRLQRQRRLQPIVCSPNERLLISKVDCGQPLANKCTIPSWRINPWRNYNGCIEDSLFHPLL